LIERAENDPGARVIADSTRRGSTDAAPSDASQTAPHPARLRYIDALRGLAALLVVWIHVANCYDALSPETAAHSYWLNDFITQIDIGRVGVVLFFLISGFVIPFSMRADGAAPVVPFAIKRFFRIFPAYWVSVPAGALTSWWMWGGEFGARDFFVNLTLLQNVFDVKSAQELYWTLLVELVFYAICVLLFLAKSLFVPRRIGSVVAFLMLIYAGLMVLHWLRWPIANANLANWLLNISVMLWGAMYRGWTSSQSRDPVARWLIWGLLAGFVVILPLGTILTIGVAHNVLLAYAIGFLVFLGGTTILRIESNVGDWLGSISYSVYLFHPVVFLPIYYGLLHLPSDSQLRHQNLAVYLAVNIVLTLILATMIFRLVERPGIRIGRRLAARYEVRVAAANAA